ncbi:cbb3-type cytochrome oxidase assembly protein CcoS [Fulvivirga sediminis]|uniref:Cbb3-type cytochrome oxidase assembly protein CcoS n=1 Tax=Fulvivirga sediminis TaxID=2803949 RepID=A0A937FD70_9BACT|nr:cbb3-type cytochrome oxidase assembly protein CcoS [Fulvivirga sediminis]MBL3658263.1 cbb3-type cytochrome oxidase assembly protein CcoS [Fulvivirga sediminis]
MSVIFVLILVSMVVAGGFLSLFIWAVKSGQFDDTMTPSMRVLFDDKKKKKMKQQANLEENPS